MTKYLSIQEARQTTGLRLVCTQGVPAPWGMAAKACFKLRGVDFALVQQLPTESNDELLEWTRHRNAPIAIYNDEPPRVRWHEIVQLAERLGSGAPLIPSDINTRMEVVGFVSEMADPYGFAWNLRLLGMKVMHENIGDEALENPIFSQYEYTPEAADRALALIQEFLDLLASRIKSQQASGSSYLFGDTLSVADIYWAYFSLMLDSMTAEKNPASAQYRQQIDVMASQVGAVDPVLITFRDQIFDRYLDVPLEF